MGDLNPHSRHHENVINQSPYSKKISYRKLTLLLSIGANIPTHTCVVDLARHAPPAAGEQAGPSLGLQIL